MKRKGQLNECKRGTKRKVEAKPSMDSTPPLCRPGAPMRCSPLAPTPPAAPPSTPPCARDYLSRLPHDIISLLIPLLSLQNSTRLALASRSLHHTVHLQTGLPALIQFILHSHRPHPGAPGRPLALYDALQLAKPFIDACEAANWPIIRTLLFLRVDPADARTRRSVYTRWSKYRYEYPLCVAAKNNHLDVVQALLAANADPLLHANYALQYAAANGHLGVVSLLLSLNADAAAHHNYAIRHACQNGHAEVARLLLQHQADPSTHDHSALLLASENGHLEIVALLLSPGTGVDPGADDGYAIYHASRNGHVAVVRLLLGHGGEYPAAVGNDALLQACRNGHGEVVEELLKSRRVDLRDL
eukprot:TRINITY_DN6499_c0_g1_i3.p1 TRINITY_DN6499_c0_g1~~TRINITY_DN6499_c0_g1_i3.p1  ORF type:complete len:359 (-),score=47.41 TRINITY_DN6499_c0_g1_i3:155-1231(-)